MKKGTKRMLVVIGMVTTLVAALTLGKNMVADEKKVYISDDTVRKIIVEDLNRTVDPDTGEEIVVENELPTVNQMEKIETISLSDVQSFEGLQYAKNAKSLSYAPGEKEVTDFRPITKLKNLETFMVYAFNQTTTPFDISMFSELKQLRSLDLGYNVSVYDFTPLSNLEKLERFRANGGGLVEFPAIYVDKTTKSFQMNHPVKYSTQFDGERSVENYVYFEEGDDMGNADVDIELDGKKVTVTNIPEKTSKIHFRFIGYSQDYNFNAVTDCIVPIVWY